MLKVNNSQSLYRWLWTYFTFFSSVLIVDFELLNVCCIFLRRLLMMLHCVSEKVNMAKYIEIWFISDNKYEGTCKKAGTTNSKQVQKTLIWSIQAIIVSDVVLVYLLVNLNIFHICFYCFYCSLWPSKC